MVFDRAQVRVTNYDDEWGQEPRRHICAIFSATVGIRSAPSQRKGLNLDHFGESLIARAPQTRILTANARVIRTSAHQSKSLRQVVVTASQKTERLLDITLLQHPG